MHCARWDLGTAIEMNASCYERCRVLIVDDSVDIHRLLKIRLRDQNIDILTASTAAEGRRIAREKLPELILLDIDLPDQSGFELLAELKGDPFTHDLAVIFVSGSVGSEEKVRGFDLGAIDYVTKPFDMAELRARVCSALRTHSLVRMLALRAHLDGLTGLWNRAHLDVRLRECVDAARRRNRPLSLVMADIDHFKRLNDTYGHPVGDRVLQDVARMLEEIVRSEDIVCRYGGEEFAIILSETDHAEAAMVAERFRIRIDGNIWPQHEDLRVTASFGVSSLSLIAIKSPEALLNSTDTALYEAKRTGRDHVAIATPDPNIKADLPQARTG